MSSVNSNVKNEGFDYEPSKLTLREKKLKARARFIARTKEKKARSVLEHSEYRFHDLKLAHNPSEDSTSGEICFGNSMAVDDISIQSTECDLLPMSYERVIKKPSSEHVADEQTIREDITKDEDSPEEMESEEDEAEQLASGNDSFEKGLLVSDLTSENIAAKSNVHSERFISTHEDFLGEGAAERLASGNDSFEKGLLVSDLTSENISAKSNVHSEGFTCTYEVTQKPIGRPFRVLSYPKVENLEKLTWHLVAKTKAAISFEEVKERINSLALRRLYSNFQGDRAMDLVSLDGKKTIIEEDFRHFEELKESKGDVFTKINEVLFSDADTVEGLRVINKHLRALASDCQRTTELLTSNVEDVVIESKRYIKLSEAVEKDETKFERFKITGFLKEF